MFTQKNHSSDPICYILRSYGRYKRGAAVFSGHISGGMAAGMAMIFLSILIING